MFLVVAPFAVVGTLVVLLLFFYNELSRFLCREHMDRFYNRICPIPRARYSWFRLLFPTETLLACNELPGTAEAVFVECSAICPATLYIESVLHFHGSKRSSLIIFCFCSDFIELDKAEELRERLVVLGSKGCRYQFVSLVVQGRNFEVNKWPHLKKLVKRGQVGTTRS